jgi:hypothetical protein
MPTSVRNLIYRAIADGGENAEGRLEIDASEAKAIIDEANAAYPAGTLDLADVDLIQLLATDGSDEDSAVALSTEGQRLFKAFVDKINAG